MMTDDFIQVTSCCTSSACLLVGGGGRTLSYLAYTETFHWTGYGLWPHMVYNFRLICPKQGKVVYTQTIPKPKYQVRVIFLGRSAIKASLSTF